MVSHKSKSAIDKLCIDIRNDDLKGLKNLNFAKLTKEDQNTLEELVYAMMEDYKHTPLELDESMPKELYKNIEDKWHFCLQIEREIRESTLARLLPNLTKEKISNAVKRHNNRFTPKHRAFNILQNKIEDVVTKSTRLWKIAYKKIKDVYNEEYKAEISATKKEMKASGTKEKVQVEKKDEEERKRKIHMQRRRKTRVQMSSKRKVCKTHNNHLLALLVPPSHLQR